MSRGTGGLVQGSVRGKNQESGSTNWLEKKEGAWTISCGKKGIPTKGRQQNDVRLDNNS